MSRVPLLDQHGDRAIDHELAPHIPALAWLGVGLRLGLGFGLPHIPALACLGVGVGVDRITLLLPYSYLTSYTYYAILEYYTRTAAVGVALGAGRHRLLQHAHKHAGTCIGVGLGLGLGLGRGCSNPNTNPSPSPSPNPNPNPKDLASGTSSGGSGRRCSGYSCPAWCQG